ncbi:heme NO-binding domain-containing protein [bacterium]|nr:heme NO-binding domain-containing protein [bacterium]
MKGTIVKCLQELVKEKFGQDKWDAVVAKVPDMPKVILSISDIDDSKAMKAIQATCEVLNITLEQAADAFGEYWMTVYAPKNYPVFFNKNKTAKDFILYMDRVHDTVTKSMENAHPPRFAYEWKDDKTLLFNYSSQRNIIVIAGGLIKGVGKYFNEEIKVTKLSESQLEIVFS